MMRALATFLLTLALAGEAVAAPLDGRWASFPEACAPGAKTFVAIDGNKVQWEEARCTLTRLAPIGSDPYSWRAQLACSRGGEGAQSVREAILAIDFDETLRPRQLIEIDLERGTLLTRRPCR